MSDSDHNVDVNRIQFLISEHEFAAEERWKYSEHSWDIYKFYMTLLSAGGGFVLAILSTSVDGSTMRLVVTATASLVFIVGVTVFGQLIGHDLRHRSVNRRLDLVRLEIADATALHGYIEKLNETEANFGSMSHRLSYSLKDQFLRALNNSGIKTQLVIINSIVGTIAVLFGVMPLSGISTRILPAISLMILLLFAHMLFAKVHARLTSVKPSFLT